MSYEDVLKHQQNLVDTYKYKALPPLYREEALRFYQDNLPEGFVLDGDSVPLFSSEGLKICDKYNRIVIGDYGAYVEVLPEDIIHENIKVKKGQEYRDFDERYSKHTKYSWLTTKDNSDVKIYFQKKTVDYADYVPGRYYFSPYECVVFKALDKDVNNVKFRDEFCDWLKNQGVYSHELLECYVGLSSLHGDVFRMAIDNNMFPGDVELWVKLNELCLSDGSLSFNQFLSVQYNLDMIEYSCDELVGPFCNLKEDVKTAIKMGVEELAFPPCVCKLSAEEIRLVLKMDVDGLLGFSHFSKVVAGCKGEEFTRDGFSVNDVNRLIEEAEKRALQSEENAQEYDFVM